DIAAWALRRAVAALNQPQQRACPPHLQARKALAMKPAVLAAALAGLALFHSPAPTQAQAAVVTKQYDDGGVYEGTVRNGRQHGRGSYSLPSGYRYEGDWVDGEIRGQGRAVY